MAARADGLTKVYGEGNPSRRRRPRRRRVPDRQVDGDHGAVGIRQVDAAALHGGARHGQRRRRGGLATRSSRACSDKEFTLHGGARRIAEMVDLLLHEKKQRP
jgi:hypothetical protein